MTKAALYAWNGPFGLPNFADITKNDFKPAFDEALLLAEQEMEALAQDEAPATIENFLKPLELAGEKLSHVCSIFFLYAAILSDADIQKLEQEFVPQLSRYSSKITMDSRLFNKIDALYQQAQLGNFDAETARVIELSWKGFVRNGAKLTPKEKQRLAEIRQRLSILFTTFSQNVLKDEAEFVLFLNKKDCDGLPEDLMATMKEIARERGQPEKYALTLARSIIEPFLCFAHERELRKIAHQAWIKRGEYENDNNNHAIMVEIIALRKEVAHLLGYANFAAFKLENSMAKTPEAVMDLLLPIWQRALIKAKEEQAELQKLMTKAGSNAMLAAYDWRYFAEKQRALQFAFDEAEIKPYFELNNMIEAAFDVANRLFALKFEEQKNIALWHEDARIWLVKDENDQQIGLFIGDYFARPSKRSGAWMSALQSQHKLSLEGAKTWQKPIIYNICNFAKPPKNAKALLSLDDAKTLFHEFGHALHGLLSNVTWPSISGTSVARDFVELPSQLYEHWLTVPEILQKHALHVETGQPIAKALLDKVLAARHFNAGFDAVEFTSSALFDMAIHKDDKIDDIAVFEKAQMQELQMPTAITMRHRPSHFSHIFSSDGYASGYYSYMWSEVLDADAFEAFEERGNVFDKEIAKRLKASIYSAGGSHKPEELYQNFRGRMPTSDALIRKRGL